MVRKDSISAVGEKVPTPWGVQFEVHPKSEKAWEVMRWGRSVFIFTLAWWDQRLFKTFVPQCPHLENGDVPVPTCRVSFMSNRASQSWHL